MIETTMFDTIVEHLKAIETEEQVRILYACESGSRAWGFPSADSDYDVRFLYARPVDWYLQIDEPRDVIERPINAGLDLSGWDLKKALRLLRKSNPPLLEWLGSPIVYADPYPLVATLRDVITKNYSPTSCMYHYLNMAQGNFRDYLRGEVVSTKKYFYVLRPLLAIRWLEQQRGIVPTEFAILVNAIVDDPTLRADIEHLLALKRAGAELDQGPRIESISRFIEHEIDYWEHTHIPHVKSPTITPTLNDIFRATLSHVWREA